MKRMCHGWNAGVFLVIAGCMVVGLLVGATAASAAFSQSDLAGTWYLVETADHPQSNGPFWSWATVTLDATGAITAGTFANSMNESGAIPPGISLTIDANGLVSSPMPPPPGGIAFPHGKLDPSKTILSLAVTEGEGDVGSMIGIKGGGSFSQADLAGTWYLVETADHPQSNGPFWSWATVTLDATGAITAGTFANSMNESGAIPPGISLTIDANGLVSSPMPPPPGGIAFPHGKLDPSKTILSLAVTEGEGDVGSMIGIKGGGSFSQADLAGTWYLVETADHPQSNGPFWSWATVTLDATGAITAGTFANSMNESGAIPPGISLTIDANGLVSSPMPPPPGGIAFPHGKLDPSKTILSLAVTEGEGDVGRMIGIKGGGGGTDKVGTFRPTEGAFYLDYNGNGVWDGCTTDRCLSMGLNGDIPVKGDWNGSGTTKVGTFRPSDGAFYLDYNGNGIWDGCGVDRCLSMGLNGDIPVVGDWDGTGFAKVGTFRPSDGAFYLDYNGNGIWDGCGGDRCLSMGLNGDIPVVGDWDGTGFAKVGTFRPTDGAFYLDYNGNGIWDGCGGDRCLSMGLNGDIPLVGDWNGTGFAKVGTFRPTDGAFYLDYDGNGQWDGCSVDRCLAIGLNGDIPVVGDWNGSGTAKVGTFRPTDGAFYLDYDGSGTWEGCGTDRCLSMGLNGDVPVVGKW